MLVTSGEVLPQLVMMLNVLKSLSAGARPVVQQDLGSTQQFPACKVYSYIN